MKTSELRGVALDWAVANALEVQVWVGDGPALFLDKHYPFCNSALGDFWVPSADWAQGGPIIESEFIELSPGQPWRAYIQEEIPCGDYIVPDNIERYGPTPLIAAMRCYVASKLGDDVDIPEELLK